MEKYLVEESWILSIGALKKDTKRIRDGETNVQGQVTLHNGNKTMQVTYWDEDHNGEKYLAVAIPNDAVPKEIALKIVGLRYGFTSFFECPGCLKRCFKLYIHPEVGKGWKCVKCHKLKYHLQSFNPYSRLGIGEYKMDQFDKLCLRKKPRMFYAGKVTKPLLRSMHRMEKIGLFKETRDFVKKIKEYQNISNRISIMSDFLRKNGDLGSRQTTF